MITQDEARAIAQQECANQGWPWIEPVGIYDNERDKTWQISIGAGFMGAYRSVIDVDKATGTITRALHSPR